MLRKSICVFLSLLMLLTMFPVGAFAGEGDVEQFLPFNDEMDYSTAVSRIKSTVSSGTVALTQDKMSGKYAVKVTAKDEPNKTYVGYTLANSVSFKVYEYSQVKLWVKPGAGAKWVKFLTGSDVLIKSDKNGDGVYKVGEDLVAGKWNELILELSRTETNLKETRNLMVQTNEFSSWAYDGVFSIYSPLTNIDIGSMANGSTQWSNGQLQFNRNGPSQNEVNGTYNTSPTIMTSQNTVFSKNDSTQGDFQGVFSGVSANSSGDLQLSAIYTSDLCTNGTAISGGNYANDLNSHNKVFDDSLDPTNGYWYSLQTGSSINGNAYVGYVWASPKNIRKVRLYPKTSNGLAYVSSAKLQYYNGTGWVDAAVLNIANSESWQEFFIDTSVVSTRWRLLANAPNLTTNWEWGLYEVEMMGLANLSGTYTSQTIDIPFSGTAANSKISWNSKTRTGLNFGGNGFVNTGNVINGLKSFTLSWWMKINSFTNTNYMGVFSQSQDSYPTNGSISFFSGNAPGSFGINGSWSDGANFDARVNIPFSKGVWKHIAVTYDGNSLKQYVDGKLLNSVNCNGKTLGNSYPFLIGKVYSYPGSLVTTYFDGEIDDFRIWNISRTDSQIQADMNNELIGNESGLMAYWKFNENSGSTAYDSVVNGHNGLVNGATWFKSDVTVKTGISTDGVTWDWHDAINGSPIYGLDKISDLSAAKLKYQVSLTTDDHTELPLLNDISINITGNENGAPSLPSGKISRVFVDSTYSDATKSLNVLPVQRLLLTESQPSVLNLSGNGKRLYYGWPSVYNAVYLFDLNTGENKKIADYGAVDIKSNFDGSKVAFKDSTNKLYYYDLKSSANNLICPTVGGFSVKNDGTLCYYNSSNSSINRYNCDTAVSSELIQGGQVASYLCVAKEENQIFYSNSNQIYAINLTPAGWKSSLLTTPAKNIEGLWTNNNGTIVVFKTSDGFFSYQISSKALRKLDLMATTIVRVADNNKLIIQDSNNKYQLYSMDTDTLKDIRPSDAKVPANANEVLFDVDNSGNKMAYVSTNGVATYYINGVQRPERYLLSFDAKNTWLTYKKGVWTTVKTGETPTEADFQKYGMTVDEVNALDQGDFESLYADGRQIYNFDVAVYFASVDPYITPCLKGITVTMKGGEPGTNGEEFETALYTAKSQSFTASNWRKMRKIYPVEIAPKEAEMYYFVVKDGVYKTYRNGMWQDLNAALLTNVKNNWIDSTNGQGISQIGMTADELRAIPETALNQLLPASNITVAYAMKVQDVSTAEYVSLISIDYVENLFESANLVLKITKPDGTVSEYSGLTKTLVEDFMTWLNERQYNRGPVFYQLKVGNSNKFINYYNIVEVDVDEL